jgi:hypothetical protein
VAGTEPETWADPSLVHVWGPRYSTFVVPEVDAPLFTLGRYPDDDRGRRIAEETATRLEQALHGQRMRDRDAVSEMTGHPYHIRYATTTGRVRIRWEGALAPTVWTVPAPDIQPEEARLQLARRFLHVFGPTTARSFASWAGIGPGAARVAFEGLASELIQVGTPIGDGWILADDEADMRAKAVARAPARLLPSGDAFYLLWDADRELLVGDAKRRNELWTSRVWPGAVLVDGDIAGIWRRSGPDVSVAPWRKLSKGEREAVEAEAASLPLPGLKRAIRVAWED